MILTEAQQDVCRKALEHASNIEYLLERDEFQEFMGRHRQRAKDLERSILNDPMSGEEREALRCLRLGLMEILDSPVNDLESCNKMLSTYGIVRGEHAREVGL